MTWGATITVQCSRTAAPPPGHGQRIGSASVQLVMGHTAQRARVIGAPTSTPIINPDLARTVHLLRNQSAFYAACECERLPDHLRGGA